MQNAFRLCVLFFFPFIVLWINKKKQRTSNRSSLFKVSCNFIFVFCTLIASATIHRAYWIWKKNQRESRLKKDTMKTKPPSKKKSEEQIQNAQKRIRLISSSKTKPKPKQQLIISCSIFSSLFPLSFMYFVRPWHLFMFTRCCTIANAEILSK